MSDVKYPEINVTLVGEDGNAFAILGRCQQAARRGGVPRDKIDEFLAEAKEGDYNHLLRTANGVVQRPLRDISSLERRENT